MTVQNWFNLVQNHPTFHSEKKVGQLNKKKRVFVGLFILLVYGITGKSVWGSVVDQCGIQIIVYILLYIIIYILLYIIVPDQSLYC